MRTARRSPSHRGGRAGEPFGKLLLRQQGPHPEHLRRRSERLEAPGRFRCTAVRHGRRPLGGLVALAEPVQRAYDHVGLLVQSRARDPYGGACTSGPSAPAATGRRRRTARPRPDPLPAGSAPCAEAAPRSPAAATVAASPPGPRSPADRPPQVRAAAALTPSGPSEGCDRRKVIGWPVAAQPPWSGTDADQARLPDGSRSGLRRPDPRRGGCGARDQSPEPGSALFRVTGRDAVTAAATGRSDGKAHSIPRRSCRLHRCGRANGQRELSTL